VACVAGQLSVEIDANMEKLAGLPGLSFDVSGDWCSGTDLSLDVGNTFTVAQYFEGRQVRLVNMYLEQSLLEGRLSVKEARRHRFPEHGGREEREDVAGNLRVGRGHLEDL
jgi:carbohydrate-selective porin OprB